MSGADAPRPAAPARDAEGAPVFAAPWEAQTFALVAALRDAGVFTWGEWAAVLGEAVRQSEAEAESPYAAWMVALERLVAEKGIAAPDALDGRRAALARAARATPHGAPILLANDPLGGRGP